VELCGVLALRGVYLVLSAINRLVIGTSLNALAAAVSIYYALLLGFAALVLWSPGLLFI